MTNPTNSADIAVPSRLGVGPMSKNAVDAAIQVAYRRKRRLMLIPSRRQVEAAEQGGGYVEGWTTETFAEYVRSRDPEGLILLCRDHGGPYQNPQERLQRYSIEQAMKSAAESYAEDIRQGFDLLHVDTSVDLDGVASLEDAIDRAVELYGQSVETARSLGRATLFEIGFEDQGSDTNDPEEFEEQVTTALERLKGAGLPLPTFIVAQTATKVMETRNVGALTIAPFAVASAVRSLVAVTRRHGIALKAHNCDYLSRDQLRFLNAAGVDALNVAPEFGVVETRAFLALLEELNLPVQRERFLEAAYDSGSWAKWMHPETTASDTDRAVIAGHYTFATEDFQALKEVAGHFAAKKGIDVDARLRDAVDRAIDHYADALPDGFLAGRDTAVAV
ncbi:class II D-tagatose-bisphosphate aldolase non-catalytic subunit [Streptomyces lavenduligriseus]|uniref:Class II D-tagatose-bisphosphate aldolase, non-catalytic subunit n=1 Tax=Streptomyces lavenduligriseus TaxID=67315 RepID=A0ABT0NYB9_9ACTN|nr:class II D-tagatose-bisphosphate aldolase, non-catalytic subunit [Streptomyces lavenduligriseus]MCL3996483.1 class II D-tagatose-bisphosphate aldolase, non-catalytic subunit [Streptomyces lavenduligriseus]